MENLLNSDSKISMIPKDILTIVRKLNLTKKEQKILLKDLAFLGDTQRTNWLNDTIAMLNSLESPIKP